MTVEELGEQLIKFILNKKSVSFANINHFFQEKEVDYQGDQALAVADYPTLVYWVNWNEFATDVYFYAEKKLGDKIEMKPCSHLVYFIDGCALTLPIAKSVRNYKTTHWIPVVLEVI